jgi:hypothetical protein
MLCDALSCQMDVQHSTQEREDGSKEPPCNRTFEPEPVLSSCSFEFRYGLSFKQHSSSLSARFVECPKLNLEQGVISSRNLFLGNGCSKQIDVASAIPHHQNSEYKFGHTPEG